MSVSEAFIDVTGTEVVKGYKERFFISSCSLFCKIWANMHFSSGTEISSKGQNGHNASSGTSCKICTAKLNTVNLVEKWNEFHKILKEHSEKSRLFTCF